METGFTGIDLFAGIGGFRLAMERCGGRCLGFSEVNKDAIETYIANHPASAGSNFGDITRLKALPQHDLLTGGVPCQSWSIAGRNLGFDDDRGQLWNDALYLLNQARPKVFLFENVKGLADPRNAAALAYILGRIRQAGYTAQARVLNSFDYGVPQNRMRIYIVGFRERRFMEAFHWPAPVSRKTQLWEILEDVETPPPVFPCDIDLFGTPIAPSGKTSSLSANNNGFNDYFLFNDIRNGPTTLHSWDILPTTNRQKAICLLLLRNRRRPEYGMLDGNPLSLAHLQTLDHTITQRDLDDLCELGILKAETYAYALIGNAGYTLTEEENFCLSFVHDGRLIPDELKANRELKVRKISLVPLLEHLCANGVLAPTETRYDFHHTKISTGLFGVNRIFLPTSNIYPTLVASDSNDYVTPLVISATDVDTYRARFLQEVYRPQRYRRITRSEACKIQGFPPDFILPEARARWMKLIGNSVSVPVIEILIRAIRATGVFEEASVQATM